MQGYGVASGKSATTIYPAGSIAMQAPYFKALGLDLEGYFMGTINVSVAPVEVVGVNAAMCFPDVVWTSIHGSETFSFSPCKLQYAELECEALVYWPHPETKPAHVQEITILEIIAPPIPNLEYGDSVTLSVNLNEIILKNLPKA